MKRILTIPLANSRPQDALVWRGDNTGTYTAKSGYRWLITEGGTRIHNELPTNFFTKLWELQVPCKIRIFMWRIANNYLPTLHNLKARQLAVNPLCPVCISEEESVDHLFRECSFTQQVLRGLEMPFSTCNKEANWKTWLVADFENKSLEACKIKSIAYWAIWYNRNKLYHERVREQVHEVVGFIKAYYTEISSMGEILQNTHDIKDSVWKPPDNDTIKINFDASFNRITRSSISGIIARDKEGLPMAACTFPWDNILDPFMAEARACLQAIVMAEELGFQDVCVEGDALTIIRKLNSREANKAAHEMAKEGIRFQHPRYWIEEVPPAVENLVNQERRNGGYGG